MAFRKTTAPSSEQIIDRPEEGRELLIVAPPLELFKEEILFWREKFRTADQAGDAVGRRMAQEIGKSLRHVALGRTAIELMAAGVAPMDQRFAGSWYVEGTSVMAYSRMWRELSETNKFNFGFVSANVSLDYDVSQPGSGGLHFKESNLPESGLEWPEVAHESQWYEGESVYLRVGRPAQPTNTLLESYEAFYDMPFVPDEHATATPFLRRDVWQVE